MLSRGGDSGTAFVLQEKFAVETEWNVKGRKLICRD